MANVTQNGVSSCPLPVFVISLQGTSFRNNDSDFVNNRPVGKRSQESFHNYLARLNKHSFI